MNWSEKKKRKQNKNIKNDSKHNMNEIIIDKTKNFTPFECCFIYRITHQQQKEQ